MWLVAPKTSHRQPRVEHCIYPTDIERLVETKISTPISSGRGPQWHFKSQTATNLGVVVFGDTQDDWKEVGSITGGSIRTLVASDAVGVGVGQGSHGHDEARDCTKNNLGGEASKSGMPPETTVFRGYMGGQTSMLWSWALDKLTDEPHNEEVRDTFELPPSGHQSQSKGDATIKRVLAFNLGRGYNSESTWMELSLTSLTHAELSGLIEGEHFYVKLPSNFHELNATPVKLQEFLKDQRQVSTISCQATTVTPQECCSSPSDFRCPIHPKHSDLLVVAASHGFLCFGVPCRQLWSRVGILPRTACGSRERRLEVLALANNFIPVLDVVILPIGNFTTVACDW
eukprot:CAMPEP_0194038268 /NCGR_PEP_ID=MMETSP0009_2-20130614/10519_1 /TAXON_ID=210454 /ORGANISM="Grammatophora oceanica, Strain CCMP 410" /LENGTH=342 /DNA_ID=CAMNT_0038680713 /DNA_START=557 /DNA_END=1582 /DNA_ORIENTATION=+